LSTPFRRPVRLDTLLAWAAKLFSAIPEEPEPRALALTFWRRFSSRPLDLDDLVSSDKSAVYCDWVERFVDGEPLAYIEGKQGFWSLDLEVTPSVLIPRADSECLVEAAVAFAKDNSVSRVLDLGTGSGCLLLSVLSELPDAKGVGIDLSAEAVAVAKRNAARCGLSSRSSWVCGSWFEPLAARGEAFDIILSNPPYIEPHEWTGHSVAQSEPHLALFTPQGEPMFAYRAICAELAVHLAPHGLAILEIGDGRGDALAAVAREYGLKVHGRRKDLSGTERALLLKV